MLRLECPSETSLIAMATGGHSLNAVDGEQVLGESEGMLVDGDHHMTDSRVPVQNPPPDVH